MKWRSKRNIKDQLPFDGIDGSEEVLSQGIVTKHDLVAPDALVLRPGYLQIGEQGYAKTLLITGYPREVEAGWLSSLYAFPGNIRVSCYIEPIDSRQSVGQLTRQMRYHQASLMVDQKRGKITDPYLEAAMMDATNLRDGLARGDVKIFQYHLHITVFAYSEDELERTTRLLEAELESKMMDYRRTTLEHDLGFKTTLPLGQMLLPRARNMDSFSISTAFPFLSSELTHDQGEIWGVNKLNNSIVLLDRFSYMNAHTTTIAASGAGKSYWLKQLLTQSRFRDIGGIIIDPSDKEYERWANTFDGTYIRLGVSSTDRINPFEITLPKELGGVDKGWKPVTEKVDYLKSMLDVMLDGLNAEEKAILDAILYLVYEKYGLTDDWTSLIHASGGSEDLKDRLGFRQMTMKQMPTLSDLLELIEEQEATKSLADRLRPHVTGSLQIFNGQTNVNLDRDLVIFDVHELVNAKGNLAPTAYFILTEFISRTLSQIRKKRVVAIDEAHFLFQHPDTALFVERLFRVARKLGAGISLITQSIHDFLDAPGAKQAMVCLQNSSLVFLMKQQNLQVVETLKDVFQLSDAEKYFLLHAARGEGILLAGSDRVALKVEVPECLHRLITTDPFEMAEMSEEQRQKVNSQVSV